MPICSFCGLERGGHWYRRVDGSRGFACMDAPCHRLGAQERQERHTLERAWRANARQRRAAARQLTLDLEEG